MLIVLLIGNHVISQNTVDSSLIKAFPFRLGNIGFAIDSMEFVVGDISRGSAYHHELQLYNFGDDSVVFTPGRISKFVEVDYMPFILPPGEKGMLLIDFEVNNGLPTGTTSAEIALETDDKENPFKFIYLIGNVVGKTSGSTSNLIIDTVPRMLFDHYNFDFGHLSRGKNVVHTFVFTNRGSQDLIIDEIISSKGISVIPPSITTIPSGSDGTIIVKVKTMASFGVQHRTVSIVSNDPVNPKIILGVHGTVRQQSPAVSKPEFCYE